ncbi:hypothetical protein KSB_31650 [Ktedonobacter robiniae]|uniref:Uncharacterized protein n=2 Tax=Ktedonobacter robiniae TaxID=2778365 RepID=A0ABQ3UPT2_9CHLR|nr:hypothetical protein KSB_31650 [Ktedonobacter robiniae]
MLSELSQIVFENDGSLRDIFVLNTSEQDWQIMLNFLRQSSYPFEFTIDGTPQELPDSVKTIFDLRQEHSTQLCIDRQELVINSFFFTEEEIDFDIHPRDINTGDKVERLLEFMRTISKLLNKEIILTPQMSETNPWYRFNPVTENEIWYLCEVI